MEQNKPLINKMAFASLILLSFWIISPIFVMIMNVSNIGIDNTYKIWISFLYVVGGLSYIPGLAYFQTILTKSKLTLKGKLFSLLPLLIFALFFLWNVLCTSLADFTLIGTFGKVPLSDSISLYFCLGGVMLSGLTIASNKKYCYILVNIFITMAVILSIISLVNNDITKLLCNNERTNTEEYQSVFYNTNHFAYYLTIALILNSYLLQYSKTRNTKIIYSITFVIFIAMLVKNNTMGAYLAVFMTLIFAIIWAFINKEDKKGPIYVLAFFIAASLIMQLLNGGIIENFASMFSDLNTVTDSSSADSDVNSAGSGRIMLWKAGIVFIKTKPFIGWGLSNVGLSAHNMFIEIMIYSGITGLIIYLSAFIVGIIRLIKKRKTINPFVKTCSFAVVAYLISGFFGVTVFYTAPYFYLILGICMSGCLPNLIDEK